MRVVKTNEVLMWRQLHPMVKFAEAPEHIRAWYQAYNEWQDILNGVTPQLVH